MKIFLQKKYIRLSLKILLSLLVLMLVLLTIASIYIGRNKQKIITALKSAVEKNINGKVNIADIDISIWSTFPYVSATLKNVSLPDSQYHRALLQAEKIQARVSFTQLFHFTSVSKISVENAVFHLFTDSMGFSNKYLFSKTNSSNKKTKSNSIIIKSVQLKNTNILIEDAVKHKKFEINLHTAKANINKSDSIFEIELTEDCLVRGLAFNLSKGAYLENQSLETKKAKLFFNSSTKDLYFEKATFRINHYPYTLSAKFHFKDSAFFELNAQVNKIPLLQAAKILTQRIQKKINITGLKNPVAIHAYLHGALNKGGDPFITVNLHTAHNELSTPLTNFSNCSFWGKFNNHIDENIKPGDSNSIILFNAFTAEWNGLHISSDSILIQNLTTPQMRFVFFSKCSLPELDENLQLQNARLQSGTAQLILQYNGPLITNAALLETINAKMLLKDGTILYEPRNLTFNNCNGEIIIAENSFAINHLSCDVKKNHFEINASGKNISRLAYNDSNKTFLLCNVKTPSINLDDFISLFDKKNSGIRRTKKTNVGSLASRLDNIVEGTMQVNLNAAEVNFKKFAASGVAASVIFTGERFEIKNARLHHANGEISVSSKIEELQNNYHPVWVNMRLSNVDVKKVFYAFDNFGQSQITSSNLNGIMNTSIAVNLDINNKAVVRKNSIRGNVDFSIKNGALINFKPLQNINKVVFKKRDFSNIRFAEIKDKLEISNSLVQINRMEISSSVLLVFVEGLYDFDNTQTDISLQLPLSNLKKGEKMEDPKNIGVDAKAGPSIYLRARPDKKGEIQLSLDVFKKFRKPQKNIP